MALTVKLSTDKLKDYPKADKLYVWQRIIYLACTSPELKIDINPLFELYLKGPPELPTNQSGGLTRCERTMQEAHTHLEDLNKVKSRIQWLDVSRPDCKRFKYGVDIIGLGPVPVPGSSDAAYYRQGDCIPAIADDTLGSAINGARILESEMSKARQAGCIN